MACFRYPFITEKPDLITKTAKKITETMNAIIDIIDTMINGSEGERVAIAMLKQARALIIEEQESRFLQTERFDIYSHEIPRDKDKGFYPRLVFQAWYRTQDVPKPVCIVTISQIAVGNYVEWIYTDEHYRRLGIATEVLRAVEADIGELCMDGATLEGGAFVEAYSQDSTSQAS